MKYKYICFYFQKDCAGISDEGPKSWGELKVRNSENNNSKIIIGISGFFLVAVLFIFNYFQVKYF